MEKRFFWWLIEVNVISRLLVTVMPKMSKVRKKVQKIHYSKILLVAEVWGALNIAIILQKKFQAV